METCRTRRRQSGAGVDPVAVIRALEALDDPLEPVAASYDTASLIDHIISRYHETHRREFGELVRLAEKVEAVHADDPEAPHGLFALLQRMRGEMEVHMKKEELLLFPAMRRGQDAELGRLIAQMRHDHDDHSAYLHELKRLTNTFEPPQRACRSWRALYGGAAKLADDLVEHVHLENNVLFARFQEGSAS